MKFKGTLTDELEPDLNTLEAKGNLYTLGMLLQPEVMGKISAILNDDKYSLHKCCLCCRMRYRPIKSRYDLIIALPLSWVAA